MNLSDSSSTDTIHRVRFKNGVDGMLVATYFLNSLSFAFSEVSGRSYGGGVMTFEPSEAESIRIPKLNPEPFDYDQIDDLLRQNDINKVLDIVDDRILIGELGFSKSKVKALRNIWIKLSSRRIYRNRN